MPPANVTERNLIKLSAAATSVLGVFAIVLGVAVNAQVMLLDGLYSFIGAAFSLLVLRMISFMGKGDSRFPFGKEMVEPLVVTLQYFAIGAMVLLGLISAVIALFTGGREVAPVAGVVYGAVTAAISLVVYLFFKRKGARAESGFVDAETNQWLVDSMLSVGILIGFGVSLILSYTPLSGLTVYADPVLVIIVSGYLITVPVREIRNNGREVLLMTPDKDLLRDVEDVVRDVEQQYGFDDAITRVAKVGDTLWVDVHYIVGNKSRARDVPDFDGVRQRLFDRLDGVELTRSLTVSFTADRKWAV